MTETITSTSAEPVATRARSGRSLALAAGAGFVGSLAIATTAPVWRYANPTWRLTLPGVPHPADGALDPVAFIGGVLLLAFGWFRLSGLVSAASGRTERARLGLASRVMALWALPIVLGPPLLSNDVYSYAAQGEIGSRGLDPTKVGPWALGGGRFWRAADDIWHYNPSPYGPLWNKLAAWLVAGTGHDPAAAVWAFRAVIVLAVVVSGVAVVALARRLHSDAAVALVLAIGNPVVLLHLVGGIHNDAVMMAFLLVGLVLARDRRRGLAFVFLCAALAVKLPAIVGLAYLGWTWVHDETSWVRRYARTAAVTLGGFALVMGISLQLGMSAGWVTALKGTGKVKSTYSVSTLGGLLTTSWLEWFHFSPDKETVVGITRGLGMLVAVAVAWWLLSRTSRLGTELAVASTLAATMIFGPVVWPWYLPPALALFAAVGAERIRPAFAVWCVLLSFAVFPSSVGFGFDEGLSLAYFGFAIVGVLVGGSLAAQWWCRCPVLPAPLLARWRAMRDRQRAAAALAAEETGTEPTFAH